MFSGRTLLIATKHKKEKVIAPILEKKLGVKCVISSGFNTDELGTFSGEIERKHDALTTARNKGILALATSNYDLVVASEGSFSPHPSNFIVPADVELLLFIDQKNGLEIFIQEISTETNFNAAEIQSEQDLKQFADLVQFGSHGLILRKYKDDYRQIKKGITDWQTLLNTYHQISKQDGLAYVETDMRALYNPSRMKVIEKATQKLANRINSKCPQCKSPGFGITNTKLGLPCELCGTPTQSILCYISICQKCNYRKEEKDKLGKSKEDPTYCAICNP